MKYIISESSLNKLINLYLNTLKFKVESDSREIFVYHDEYTGLFNYDYDESELAISPYEITVVSGMFNMDRGQAMEGIAEWFIDKFDVKIFSVREWDW